jgi:hypothetical protein
MPVRFCLNTLSYFAVPILLIVGYRAWLKRSSAVFTAIAFPFLAGMHFTRAVYHSGVAEHEYDDFFFLVGWLTMAIGAGVRLLKATRPSLS